MTLYVLSGTYRFRLQETDPDSWHEISEGHYAQIPEGSFMIEIKDPQGTEIVCAFEIPERYRLPEGPKG